MPSPIWRRRHPFRVFFKEDSAGVIGFGEENSRGWGYVNVWHRRDIQSKEYAVANELISGEIAKYLRLPIPPFGVTCWDSSEPVEYLFTTLDFNSDHDQLPFANPERCVDRQPVLCTGILLFDILIANPDRLAQNLFTDNPFNPSRVWIYDHEQALLGGTRGEGIARLSALKMRLGLCYPGSDPEKATDWHCFLPRVRKGSHFKRWYDRIKKMPEWFVRDVCKEAVAVGISREEADAVVDFLLWRRKNIAWIVEQNRTKFAKATWRQKDLFHEPEVSGREVRPERPEDGTP